jgi:hypothetical protein
LGKILGLETVSHGFLALLNLKYRLYFCLVEALVRSGFHLYFLGALGPFLNSYIVDQRTHAVRLLNLYGGDDLWLLVHFSF